MLLPLLRANAFAIAEAAEAAACRSGKRLLKLVILFLSSSSSTSAINYCGRSVLPFRPQSGECNAHV